MTKQTMLNKLKKNQGWIGIGLLISVAVITITSQITNYIPPKSLIIAILVAVWIYRDANSRGMSGILWLILLIVMTLFLNLIGFIIIIIIYLIVRKDRVPYPPST